MPRYFFDARGLYPDDEGFDWPDQQAAEAEAIRTLGELVKDVVPNRTDVLIELRTEDGPLFRAAFIFETNNPKQ
ncbi:hypothetical protein FDV58_28875 [Bradyrhizobium elkanii]|uniref:DUF6894 domain-containing protein n=1 Tax=Bradyrhizobium elkanii TaxID=29448 RepID=A0A4U6RU82_BRAEL|nr:hypothetical protein [Bradyrhizobium elkanii]TKV77881.1 hypothetical protein FDV58_28875 [Bradyrhizobium elkanii]